MREGEEFILSFVHSVNKRPVYDTLRVEGNHFLIVKSVLIPLDRHAGGFQRRDGVAIGRDGWMSGSSTVCPEVTFFVDGWQSFPSPEGS